MTTDRILRWLSLFVIGSAFGCVGTLMVQANALPDQHVQQDCCRDLGYLQTAVIERINKVGGEWRPKLLIEALAKTGLICKWAEVPGNADPIFECR